MGVNSTIINGPDRHAMCNSLLSYGLAFPEYVTFSYDGGNNKPESVTGVVSKIEGVDGNLFRLYLKRDCDMPELCFLYNPFGKEQLKGYLLDKEN